MQGNGNAALIEKKLTEAHAKAVEQFLKRYDLLESSIDIIGFHGQTIFHDPKQGVTCQLGNGSLLAELTNTDVIYDFRSRDIAAGGEGAPLVPLYHQALMKEQPLPIAVVNIGGVSNVTFLGDNNAILAFDIGPGNALLDDWISQNSQHEFDTSGEISSKGKEDPEIIEQYMSETYFTKTPPKSLDRNHFSLQKLKGKTLEDGAATLVGLTAKSIIDAEKFFPEAVNQWIITGGGRHNDSIMQALEHYAKAPVINIDALGYKGDFIEAQAFAFLAVRALKGLPLTLPSTTGVEKPVSGGAFCRVKT